MKIALLGYGLEAKAAEKYFKTKFKNVSFDIFKDETLEQIKARDYSSYDIILRSPSIPPLKLQNETSLTRYFFEHCPCTIIGVTATKGKGTTCSFIKSLLDAEHQDAYLVGNIGNPAIEVLDKLTPESVVVYEMSSFQLWDLEKSPHIAVIGHLEPDHLNVHEDYSDYLGAKSHITRYQTNTDYLIYNQNNPETVRIANSSKAQKIPYPFEIPEDVKKSIKLPGRHNQDDAIAAIAAVASYKNISPDEYLRESTTVIKQGLSDFKGLPHRLEFVRELNGVKYYDDNFATNASSTRVAIESFPDDNLILIVGGRDKTDYEDLPEIYESLQSKNVKKVILIGESGHELAKKYQDSRFKLAESLEEAINNAVKATKDFQTAIVVMSPGAASFDIFKNAYDRGDQFKELINKL